MKNDEIQKLYLTFGLCDATRHIKFNYWLFSIN